MELIIAFIIAMVLLWLAAEPETLSHQAAHRIQHFHPLPVQRGDDEAPERDRGGHGEPHEPDGGDPGGRHPALRDYRDRDGTAPEGFHSDAGQRVPGEEERGILMTGPDTWTGETPMEKAKRILRLNGYANAVTACGLAFEKINKLGKKTRKPKKKKEENHEESGGTQGRG